MIDDEHISKIAEDAVNKVFDHDTPQQPRYEHKAFISKPSTPQTYYRQRFYGLSDKAKDALNKAYLMRKEPFTDKRWIELMVDFTEETKKAYYTGEESDLRTFKTMAVYYAERYRQGGTWHKSKEFQNTIKEEFDSYRKQFARPDLC